MIKTVLKQFDKYLKIKVPNFSVTRRGKCTMLTCPFCNTIPLSCTLLPVSNKLRCFKCNKIFTLFDIVKEFEPDKTDWSESQIVDYLVVALDLRLGEGYSVGDLLNFYELNQFDLLPIARNQKVPIEKEWPTRIHKDKSEWESWLKTGLNIGVKTGKASNLLVIDIDQKDIPKALDSIKGTPLIQYSTKGVHLFYKYDKDIPQSRLQEYKIDIRSDGGQIVIAPSSVDDVKRIFHRLIEIPQLPDKVKEFLLAKKSKISLDDTSSPGEPEITPLKVGERNISLMHLGGILRKNLNFTQTEFVLKLINSQFVSPPLSDREFQAQILSQLEKYIDLDDTGLAMKVLSYLKMVDEAYAGEVREALGEAKQKVDKALSFLVKEGLVIKSRRLFSAKKRADWKDSFPSLNNEVKFKMPYFHDVGIWCEGDLLLLGGINKAGKTTIAVNIVQDLVRQGVKPYYISLETGSRFIKTALQLGLKEGDFYWDFVPDPTKVELEPNAVTILDWLSLEDKAMTDTVMKHFVEQLYRTSGLLIVFQQLKMDGTWFAPNLISHFPALSARYLYEKVESGRDGEYGYWICEFVREPLFKGKIMKLPCRYDFDTKLLKRIDES